MRCKLFLLSGIMGLAVISGIIKGLSAPRGGEKKEEEEKAGEKEERTGDENPAN
jgi:hypothetical protein